jgi:chorismate synthase
MTIENETRPIDRLLDRVNVMAAALGGMDIGNEVFCQFTCHEIESVADVLRTVGQQEVADLIIEWHGAGDDDPEDWHHEYYNPTHHH